MEVFTGPIFVIGTAALLVALWRSRNLRGWPWLLTALSRWVTNSGWVSLGTTSLVAYAHQKISFIVLLLGIYGSYAILAGINWLVEERYAR